MNEITEAIAHLHGIRDGDILRASTMNVIGTALELLRADMIDRGLVCGHCECIIREPVPFCPRCGAPMGRGIPLHVHFGPVTLPNSDRPAPMPGTPLVKG